MSHLGCTGSGRTGSLWALSFLGAPAGSTCNDGASGMRVLDFGGRLQGRAPSVMV